MSFDEPCEVSPQTFLITPTQKCVYNNSMTIVIFVWFLAGFAMGCMVMSAI